uniref:Transmembrane protein 209 n=2 Tax=Timema TaxID=61471 RepID=A0A7R9PJ51_TIMGE|nr:unnamed protein product [Timema genevievae]
MSGRSPLSNMSVQEQALTVTQTKSKTKRSLLWATINACLCAIFLYDFMNLCPYYSQTTRYLEGLFVFILAANCLYHLTRYLRSHLSLRPVIVTPAQKKLMGIKDADPYFRVSSTPKSEKGSQLQSPNLSLTPLNLSSTSWRSSLLSTPHSEGLSSPNFSMSSSSWMFNTGSPDTATSGRHPLPPSATPTYTSTPNVSSVDFIEDEKMLAKYLREFDAQEKKAAVGMSTEQPSNFLNTFWNYTSSRTTAELSPMPRCYTYQMAPPTPHQASFSTGLDENGCPLSLVPKQELWRKFKVDASVLTQWNANLRMWLSRTILERLVLEMDQVDEAFQRYGLSDVRVGGVGLERLKKTSRTIQAIHNIPVLVRIIPFLELTSNQEYLINRIRELAKGGCISEFRWNGGGNFHGKPWEDHLPTDSDVVMHLLATYLDTQLPPVPQNPDSRPFTSQYLVKAPDNPPKDRKGLLLHQVQLRPPHFVVLDDTTTLDVGKLANALVVLSPTAEDGEIEGYNNFFHTILLFLHLIKTKEHAMLGRVNLGPSGINILWVIDS